MSVRRYPEYKDTGVAWLGQVPAHWGIKRYKEIFAERDERSADGSETLLSVSAYTGVSPRSEIVADGDHLSRAESLEGYKVCYPDDLVMNIMLAWNRGLGFSSHQGIVSPAYSVFRLRSSQNPRFLDYLVRDDRTTLYFKAHSAGVIESRLRLYPDVFGSLYCTLPPKEEQTAIATFLDHETGKIEALIAEQEKLLALIAEKRRATISYAVTKGLNRDAAMRDSGAAWLGEVPAHWELKPMRYVSHLNPTISFDDFGEEDELTFLPMEQIKRGYYLPNTAPLKKCNSSYSTFDRGDILLAKVTPCFENGNIAIADTTGFGTSEIFVLRPQGIEPRVLYWHLQSAYFKMHGEASMTGAGGLKRVSTDMVCRHLVPTPPPEEQTAIATFLDTETAKLDALKTESERAIDLLKERRSALIAAAVTGQIDVRGLVPEQEAA